MATTATRNGISMNEPGNFVQRIVQVQAMQYTGDNLHDFVNYAAACAPVATRKVNNEGEPLYIVLEARQRMRTRDDMVPIGFWLIKHGEYDFQVDSDDNFKHIYEREQS